MACSGKCTITKSEKQNQKILRVRKQEGCPNLGKRRAERAVTAYLAPILADKPDGCKGRDEDGKPKCDCTEIPNQNPPWGPWKKYTKTIPVRGRHEGRICVYQVSFEVEIRKRVFDGICYDKELPDNAVDEGAEEDAMFLLPDYDFLAFRRSESFTEDDPLKD